MKFSNNSPTNHTFHEELFFFPFFFLLAARSNIISISSLGRIKGEKKG